MRDVLGSVAAEVPHPAGGASAPRRTIAATDSPLSRVARALEALRRIIGVPDYQRYAEHMAEHHPGQPVMTEREFADDHLKAKYSRPGQRCC